LIAVSLTALLGACQPAGEATGPSTRAASTIALVSGDVDPIDPPPGYFAAFGTKWYYNVHNWNNALGKRRWHEPLDRDLSRLLSTGGAVMRYRLGVEGAVYPEECGWRAEPGCDAANRCYEAAFAEASRNGWRRQIAALDQFGGNPVIAMFVDGARRLERAGFHLMISPNDFYWGSSGASRTPHHIPLVHQYLETDDEFQEFYVAWSNRLVAELSRAGVRDFSFQAINEPRFSDPAPRLREWARLERRIFDGVRAAAPGVHLVSSAICTSADNPLAKERRYTSLTRYLPSHDLENVSYSLHMRNPRLLHTTADISLRDGVSLSYPHEPLPRSAASDEKTAREVERYNIIRPDREHYDRVFADIASVAAARRERIIITEWAVAKSSFGLPREDQVRLVRGVLEASKRHGVPIMWDGLQGNTGLGVAPHSFSTPDHDFDPLILDAFTEANG
jgi:hypothetical protein